MNSRIENISVNCERDKIQYVGTSVCCILGNVLKMANDNDDDDLGCDAV
jgi:hypothetical protein